MFLLVSGGHICAPERDTNDVNVCKFIAYIFKRWINKAYYYITGSNNIVRYIEDFVKYRCVISRFHCIKHGNFPSQFYQSHFLPVDISLFRMCYLCVLCH